MTFSQKEVAQKSHALVLFRGYSVDGQQLYAYVYASFPNLMKFKEDTRNKASIAFQDYGNVIEWGYGDPPQDVMERMRDEFGFNHESDIIIEDGPTAQERKAAEEGEDS